MPQRKQSWQFPVFFWTAETGCTARAICQLPKEIRRVAVCMTSCSSEDTGVYTNKDADEMRGEGIHKVTDEVSILAGWSIAS